MAKRAGKMTETELSSLLAGYERDSLSYLGGTLSDERAKALDYYLGQPFGNEIEGRSQVVSTDVADTVEWILPSLLKIFTAGDDVVRFEPQGPEDEAAAKQATEYVNWIFTRDNPGFLILYSLFKDALLQKNGVGKVWWEEKQDEEKRTVEGVDDLTYSLAVADPDIEIVAHTARPSPMEGSQPAPRSAGGMNGVVPPPAAMPPAAPAQLHDYTYTRKRDASRVRIEPVPPEEFLIGRRDKTIAEAVYVAHRVRKTLSELIEEGYSRETVEELPSDGDGSAVEWTAEAQARRQYDEDSLPYQGQGALRWVWVTESYPLVDWDGDGIAERRQVVSAGKGTVILKNEPWQGPPPFVSITPIIMPHRFYGLSVADLVMDLQLIKSTVLRQILDNLYLSNNPRHVISDQVELDDLLITRPGGIVRLKPGQMPGQGHILPIETQFVAAGSFPLLEYLDTIRENRTGVTRYNQGIDANSLNKTATGISQIMSAAAQRIELIARVFAETGVKDLFGLILESVTRYQDKPRVIRLRNEWVAMDPREWESKFDLSINVGLGTGNKDQMLGHLVTLGQMLGEIVKMGGMGSLVTPENVYNLLTKIVENSGLKSPEAFFTDPATAQQQGQPQQPPPDPKMIEVQGKLQLAQQGQQAEQQAAAQKTQADQALAAQKLQQDARLAAMTAATDHQTALEVEKIKAAASIETARIKAGADLELGLHQSIAEVVSEGIGAAAEPAANGGSAPAPAAAPIAPVQHAGRAIVDGMQQLMAAHQATLAAIRAPRNTTTVVHRGSDGKIAGASTTEH